MSLNNTFTNLLPKLDLHGETSDTARVLINDFINDNFKMKKEKFVIVHGIGTGVLKQVTKQTLKNNNKVLEFTLDFMNPGATIVRIKI